MRPVPNQDADKSEGGTSVVFPAPGSAESTAIPGLSSAERSSGKISSTGSPVGAKGRGGFIRGSIHFTAAWVLLPYVVLSHRQPRRRRRARRSFDGRFSGCHGSARYG